MSSFFRSAALLFSTHVRRMLRSRRMLIMGLLALLPAALGTLVAFQAEPEWKPWSAAMVAWFVTLQALVPFVALIAGSAVVSEELEDGTLAYVFTRPVSRTGFFIGRWLAASVTVLVAVVPMAAGIFLPVMLVGGAGTESIGDMASQFLPVAALTAVVYTSLFAFLGCINRHPVILGLAYAAVIEGLLSNLPGTTARLSVQHHARSILVQGAPEHWSRPAEEVLADLLYAHDAVLCLAVGAAIFLVLGMLVIRRREYLSRSGD